MQEEDIILFFVMRLFSLERVVSVIEELRVHSRV
jgi:hypothetical protein